MTTFNQDLHPRGQAGNSGQFADVKRTDPGLILAGEDDSHGPTGHAALLTLDSEHLWPLVNGGPEQQVVAARAIHLSADQADQLAGHDQPFAVRLAVTLRADGVRAAAVTDPDPVIRAMAMTEGVGLSEEVRAQLAADPAVVRACTVFGLKSAHVQGRDESEVQS